MPADLAVTIPGGSSFHIIHALQNGIFSVLAFYADHRLLLPLLPLDLGSLRDSVSKKIQLGTLDLSRIGQNVICHQIQSADQKSLVHDPIIQRHKRLGNMLG